VKSYRCGTCTKFEVGDDRPEGWYKLNICGEARPRSDAVHPGLFCSTDCLLVAVMATCGMSARQVKEWLGVDA
jgi:hypothetical protein